MARRRRPDGGGRVTSAASAQLNNALSQFGRRHPAAAVVLVVLALLAAGAYLWWQQRRADVAQTQPAEVGAADHLLLGNPSGATASPANRDDFLLVKPHYVLSYNNSTGTANWVSWRVTYEDLGDAPRKQQFDADDDLPKGFKRVVHKDYSGSGFDRGHLCPAGDRAGSPEASFATFVMTNIIPQAPNVNQGAWKHLEDYCRDLVEKDRQRLYIIAGPAGVGGRGLEGRKKSIGRGKVAVPAQCWKVIVAVPEEGGDDADYLARITSDTRVIAVIMPNDEVAIRDDWTRYRVSVAEVEELTGFRFFRRLEPDVAEALRQAVDRARVKPPARRKGRE